jgi:hypothetical protein
MLLGTNIAARSKATMEILAKTNTSTNLGLPIDKEKGRTVTRVHGVDRVVGSGPNAFLVDMASGNSGIRGTEVLWGGFRRGGGRER